MPSLREQIVDDIVAMLNTGSPPAVARRSYTFQIDLETGPSIIVFPIVDVPEAPGGKVSAVLNGLPVRRRLTVAVEIRAKGTDSSRADEAVDPIISWAVGALAGKSKGVGSGNLYHSIMEGPTTFEVDQADHAYCLARVEFEVSYQSRAGDPSAWV